MSAQTTYPLSPLQQGMLFHALAEPRSGVDIEQLVFTLREAVDGDRLQAAWVRVVGRHGILRTRFRWDGEEPVQEVRPVVEVPFVEDDAPGMDETAWARWLREDRVRGFAMDAAPLMRFRLFRHGEEHWRLVWTFHHALLDGRSFPPLIEEAFRYYDAPGLPEPAAPRPYWDFIEWHRGRDHAGAEGFWREKLRGFRAPTPLALEGLGNLAKEREQGDAEVSVSAMETEALKALASVLGVTLNTLVQGAWAILLQRMSGEEDVCFGATRAGRKGTIEGAEGMMGLLINTVPVRVRAGDERPLAEFLRELRQYWIDVRPHEHTPLARVQAWSEVPAGQALFRTLVVFENYDLATHFRAQGGVWQQRAVRLYEQTNFPICLAAYAGESLRLVAEYDRSRLDGGLVKAMLGQLANLLSAMPQAREGVLGDLPLLSVEAAGAMLRKEAREFPVEGTLHAQFARQAARTPDAVALVQGETRMTYAELEARANAVARELLRSGVRNESIVGLCLERCPELVVALLGILKANAAYLPIDLAYPPERLAFMLADAQAPVLLTQRHLADRLPPGHGARLVLIEDIAAEAGAEPLAEGSVEQLCYVLYTSGSTGKPKGCCITHRNVARLFTATDAWFHFGASDVWTLFHSTAFDFSVWEIWGALLYGGTLVVVPFEVSRSPELFHELLVRERVTVLNQTPSAFRQLMAADEASARSGELSLREVIFGGEALEMWTLQPWFARHGDARPRLVNMYGITETTVHVTYRPLRAGDVARGSVIGEPIPDLQLLVLDAHLRPVPVGVPGELFVGGAGLARGYHQREELTAQRFLQHPTSGARLYRTGDLARRLPDGELEYLGRIDQQVKIRGFRIELGEIESVLLRHRRVREAVVLARDDGHGGKKLVAWVVENQDAAEASNAELRAHLKASLPDYMVPASLVRLAQMPLTNNGKLDLRALPEPAVERETEREFVGPRNDAERALAEIWQQVLKLQRVGVDENFFELGGDSILSILVVSRARQRGFAITPKQIFDRPTIAGLAEVCGAAPAAAKLPETPLEGEVPLTPIQCWFFAQSFPEPHHWNQSLSFLVREGVTREQLARAFAAVVAAHPVFRLRYGRAVGGGWRQRFGELPEALEFRGDTRELQRALRLEGPLVRYVFDEAARRLTIAAHHLVMDGVSWRVLAEDLDAALCGKPLAERTTGFHTWARTVVQVARPADEAAHWRELAGEAAPEFSADKNLESTAATHVLTLTEAETTQLRGRGLHEVLLAVTAEGLRKLDGAAEHVIDVEGHGREEAIVGELAGVPERADLSHTIGWFTTLHPFRLQAGATPEDTLERTAAGLAAVPRKGFGYLLGKQGRAAVLFNYLGEFDQTTAGLESLALEPLEMAHWHAPSAPRTHALEINALIARGQLEIRVTYGKQLHSVQAIRGMAETMSAALRQLAGAPAKRQLAGLDEDTRGVLLARYPDVEDAFPLSPMQRLFLSMELARPGSGSEQWEWRLAGRVDAPELAAAWQKLMRRHAVLRSAYAADLPTPHAVILAEALAAWHTRDLRGLPEAESREEVRAYTAAEAVRPFDMAQAPLTRFALFQLADEEHLLVWTHHHLEIDGWSWPILVREWDAILRGETLAPAAPYRDYVAWLARRTEDGNFWREYLAGFRTATPLPFAAVPGEPAAEISHVLPPESAARLVALAREMHVTPNVLVQTAWALLLAHHAGREDVVFGAAFSGRPAELPGAEGMVGHFVSNLPVRVVIPFDEKLSAVAQRLHGQLAGLAEHQYTPLAEIQACSELPWNERLFGVLVVYQNYLGAETKLGGARLEDYPGIAGRRGLHPPVRTNYPLTLVVTPGEDFGWTLVSQAGVARREDLEMLAAQFVAMLGELQSDVTCSALKPAGLARKVADTMAVGPATSGAASALERVVAEIWEAALGRPVAVTENFFDAGGYSLLMLRVHARLTEKLGREIPVVMLFQHPTIRALASALGDAAGAKNEATLSAAQDRASKARAAIARRPQPLRKP